MSLVITDAGIAASIQAGELGIQYKITHISIGREGYVPTADQTELRNEIQRKAITKGEHIGLGRLHFETVWDGQEEFEGKELGYWLEDGTLFAVDSRNGEVITYKRADTVVTEAVELTLSASSLSNITVELMGAPLATERVAGIAKIATSVQVNEGTDDSAFLTIKKLLQRAASLTKTGVVQLSSSVSSESEAQAATPKAVKAVFDQAIEAIDILGLSAQMWLGEFIPNTHTELDGKSFDKVLNPKMAALFPSGVLPDTRGMVLKHAPYGRQVLSFEADAVKSHLHTASQQSHGHNRGSMEIWGNFNSLWTGQKFAEGSFLNTVQANVVLQGTGPVPGHDGTVTFLASQSWGGETSYASPKVTVNASGAAKNLVDNIAVKFIIRKA